MPDVKEEVNAEGPAGGPVGFLEYWSGDDRLRVSTDEEPEVILPALQSCLEGLRQAGEECAPWLAGRAPEVLEGAAGRWMAALESRETVIRLADDCRMAPEMVREASRNFFPRIQAPALRRLQERWLGPSGPFPEPDAGGIRLTPLPPAVVFHVPAGNLFLSAVESLIHASLCGACSLVRAPSSGREALFLWLTCLEEADPRTAQTVALGRWPRDASRLTGECAARADAVVAFGDDDSVRSVRNQVPPGTRFLAHGAKLSFAVIGAEALAADEAQLRRLARELAYDFSVYDQQGCLSPRAAFLQATDLDHALSFARRVRDAMAELAHRLPPPPLGLEEAAALTRTRANAAVESAAGGPMQLLSAMADPFVVTLSPARDYRPGCLNRNADLRVFGDLEELIGLLSPWRGRISTMGVAGAPEAGRLARALRVPRLCPVGQMQRPPLGWLHDGHLPLVSLIDWSGQEMIPG